MDAGAIAGFLTGLRVYLDDPAKVKRLLLPTKLSGSCDGKKATKADESSPSLMNLLMGVKVLQQAIIDLLLDIWLSVANLPKWVLLLILLMHALNLLQMEVELQVLLSVKEKMEQWSLHESPYVRGWILLFKKAVMHLLCRALI